MIMSNQILKKIIIPLICIGVLGYFGYILVIKSPSPSTLQIVEPTNGESATGQDILTLTDRLKNSTLDQTIFSSELFKKLQDFGTVLISEPQGRSNPFAQIGIESGSDVIGSARVTGSTSNTGTSTGTNKIVKP
jgi:hypothetical protein